MPEFPTTDESIFATAAALPAEERAAYLDAACGDAARRERVEQLLRSHKEAGSFLERPPVAALTTDFVPLTETVGGVIGRYKLLQAIGEGGFGVVYMAEQKEPIRRKVALKVIKLGMDSKEIVARFEAERQALALMDHPNIAKVLDAGATDAGRPYFVMELVKGVPIVEFCDKNQLPARERLALFAAVCQAVQHAHQKGIIHRDLKPSNVLVTLHDGKPVPKVIDFGVAKALNQELTEKTLFTAFGHMVGTPQYMSPEQAEMSGLDIDTRSDIYSLGVLLYELLTGTTPLDGRRLRSAGYAEMQRMIREEEPPRPSLRLSTLGERLSVVAKDRQSKPMDLQRLLHGELDWIVMKALEKDRARRYDTATGMAKDVERYLAGDTVEACPPSASYRLRKFARKHRQALALAAAFALLLVTAVVMSSWQAVRATLAEGDATKKSNALAEAETQVRAERDDARDARDELRGSLYAARANLIQTAWRSDNMSRVLQLLDQQRPRPGEADLRGFEWHYYQRLAHADLRTLDLSAEFASGVLGTLLSPDGSRLAAITPVEKESNVALVRVWDLAMGKEVFSARVDFGNASMAFSRDGKRLVVATMSMGWQRLNASDKAPPPGRLVVWDCETGEERFTAGGDSVGVALSWDGRRVAAAFQRDRSALPHPGDRPLGPPPNTPPEKPIPFAQEIKIWDVDTRKELGILRDVEPPVREMTLSPEGDRLAAILVLGPSSLPELRLWEVGGKERWTIRTDRATASVQFSPDGTRLACSTVGSLWLPSRQNYELKLYNAVDGKESLAISAPSPLRNAVFSPDGKLLAGGAGPNVQVDDVAGKESLTLKGHSALVTGVAFSADGTHLVSVDSGGVVKVWATPPLGSTRKLDKLAPYVSPDGMYRLSFIQSGPGGPRGFGGPVAGDNVIKVFDRAGKPLYSFDGHTAGITQVQFSPDSRYVVSSDQGSRDMGMKTLVWEAATGKQRLNLDGRYVPTFSASGNRIAGWAAQGGLKIWDTKDFEERFSLPDQHSSLRLSPDGSRLLVLSMTVEEGRLRSGPVWKLWDLNNAREVATIPCGNSSALGAFDAASKHVAVIDGTDITVWDAVTGSQVTTLRCPDASGGIVMNADGTLLAALRGGPSGRFPRGGALMSPDLGEAPEGVAIWDVAAGKVRYRLKGHTAKVWDVAFSPDGKRIASLAAGFGGGRVGEVKLWDAATGAELLELQPEIPLPATKIAFNAAGTRLSVSSPSGRVRRGDSFVDALTWDATPLPEK